MGLHADNFFGSFDMDSSLAQPRYLQVLAFDFPFE